MRTHASVGTLNIKKIYIYRYIFWEFKQVHLFKNYILLLTQVSCFSTSQTIFNAVVLYMKHLGVKNKAADSKKSKGGFFTRKTKVR